MPLLPGSLRDASSHPGQPRPLCIFHGGSSKVCWAHSSRASFVNFSWIPQEVNPLFLQHSTRSAVLETWVCGFPSLLAYKLLRALIPNQPLGPVTRGPALASGRWKELSPAPGVWAAGACVLSLTLSQRERARCLQEPALRGQIPSLSPPPPCGLCVAFLPGVLRRRPPPAGGFDPLKRTSVLGDRGYNC